ncbi:MAG: hypothetical protein ACKVU4_13030 [Phycisphaerales bacterium]
MPYDSAEEIWKIHVYTQDGQPAGFFEPENWLKARTHGDIPLDPQRHRTWPGRPRAQHFEVLYRLVRDDGIDDYLVLYRFGQWFTERDYGRILPPERAAAWFEEEGYPLPEDLKAAPPPSRAGASAALIPLSEALSQVWKALDGRAMTAKQLATHLTGRPTDEDAMRKRTEKIRATGRQVLHRAGLGYYRPDAPPPESA